MKRRPTRIRSDRFLLDRGAAGSLRMPRLKEPAFMPLRPKPSRGRNEIAFQREMLAEIKLNPGQAVIMHDDHTGKPLTRRDVFNQYSVLLHVCADKNVPE